MEKNIRLADIYIKIYNRRPLTMEDLTFLAKYDRECFEKTCRNLIYNMPEAGELMEPMPEAGQESQYDTQEQTRQESVQMFPDGQNQHSAAAGQADPETVYPVNEEKEPEIDVLLENLKKMEWEELPVPNVNADRVKNLLGSLYMEMLFPHNDRYRYFKLEDHTEDSRFNKKA